MTPNQTPANAPGKPRSNTQEQPATLEWVYTVRLSCPRCGGFSVPSYKSINQGDGSLLLYRRCRDCDTRFREVSEPGTEPNDCE